MPRWIEAFSQDLRYALRGLRKSPAFTLIAILTLALGVGATTAVFSVINQLLLRPLPYPDSDRLIAVSNIFPGHADYRGPVSAADVSRWRADSQVFEKLEFISGPDVVAMSGAGSGERVAVQHMSAQIMPLLGVKSFMGNLPTDDLTEKQGSPGVLISYEFWQHHFGGDPKILGKSIFVDTFSGPVLAVLQPGFDLFGSGVPEVYLLSGAGNEGDAGVGDVRWMVAVGKLKRGVSVEQAQAAMEVRTRHLAQAFPTDYKNIGIKVETLQKRLFGWWGNVYSMLLGAAGLVLLIACSNVANLLLVRGDGRQREIAVRVALGASRKSLIRQILTESVLLSGIGGAAGLVLSFLGVRILSAWAPFWFPGAKGFPVDGRVLAFTFAICAATGIAFGLIPAYRAVSHDANEGLREGGRNTATISRHRTRNSIIVAEIALALVLLICAGLMINTVTRIVRTNPGFNPERLLTAEVRLTGDKYIDASDPEKKDLNAILPPVGEFCRRALERIQNLPGVDGVALADWLPLLEVQQPAFPGFTISGQTLPGGTEKPKTMMQAVSSDYFRLMSIPVLSGRGITEQDTESNAWVAVINETMARQFWPNRNSNYDPIGQTITLDDSPQEKPRTVVGIVGDVRQFVVTQPAQPEIYIAYQQVPRQIYSGWSEARVHKSLIIRTHASSAGSSDAMIESVRRQISELAPESALFGITTVDETISNSATTWRFLCRVLQLFAAIALILAVIGIYGVISYSIGERRHELGLRMALGAQRAQVLALVLRQAMVLSLIGVGIGVAGSFAATPLISDFLYGVKAHDPLTLLLVSSLLTAVTLVASYIPARHAMKIDPMRTLRHE